MMLMSIPLLLPPPPTLLTLSAICHLVTLLPISQQSIVCLCTVFACAEQFQGMKLDVAHFEPTCKLRAVIDHT